MWVFPLRNLLNLWHIGLQVLAFVLMVDKCICSKIFLPDNKPWLPWQHDELVHILRLMAWLTSCKWLSRQAWISVILGEKYRRKAVHPVVLIMTAPVGLWTGSCSCSSFKILASHWFNRVSFQKGLCQKHNEYFPFHWTRFCVCG